MVCGYGKKIAKPRGSTFCMWCGKTTTTPRVVIVAWHHIPIPVVAKMHGFPNLVKNGGSRNFKVWPLGFVDFRRYPEITPGEVQMVLSQHVSGGFGPGRGLRRQIFSIWWPSKRRTLGRGSVNMGIIPPKQFLQILVVEISKYGDLFNIWNKNGVLLISKKNQLELEPRAPLIIHSSL